MTIGATLKSMYMSGSYLEVGFTTDDDGIAIKLSGKDTDPKLLALANLGFKAQVVIEIDQAITPGLRIVDQTH